MIALISLFFASTFAHSEVGMQSSLGSQDSAYQSPFSSFESVLPADEVKKCKSEEEKGKVVPQCSISDRQSFSNILSTTKKDGLSKGFDAAQKKTFDVNKAPKELNELLDFASLTPSGSSAVAKFLELQSQGKIKVERVHRSQMSDPGWGAMYGFKDHTIYLDRNADLGTIAPAFIHEFNHALNTNQEQRMAACQQMFVDKVQEVCPPSCAKAKRGITLRTCSDLNCRFENALSVAKYDTIPSLLEPEIRNLIFDNLEACRAPVIFKGERKAFDAQYKFIEELKQKYPCYDSYISAQKKNENIIDTRVTNSDITKRYQLSMDFLKKSLGPEIEEPTEKSSLKNFPKVSSGSTRIDYYKCLDRFLESSPTHKAKLEQFFKEQPGRDLMRRIRQDEMIMKSHFR